MAAQSIDTSNQSILGLPSLGLDRGRWTNDVTILGEFLYQGTTPAVETQIPNLEQSLLGIFARCLGIL